jgi:YHS domain-containing protein
MKNNFKLLIRIAVLLIWIEVNAQSVRIHEKHSNLEKGLALQGYDPVSYFQGKPAQGSKIFRYLHNGIYYQFVSQENMIKFKKSPSSYEPQYGGWCAYAMGINGEKVKIDPETYSLEDGRLYLFYNFWGNNTLKDWRKKGGGLRHAADKNWTSIITSQE